MTLVLGILKVLIGGFVLFTVARVTYARWVPYRGWLWVTFMGVLALGNMLVHRWIGSSINPPFFTAALFAVTLFGLAEQTNSARSAGTGKLWIKRGLWSVVIFTTLGWISYGNLVQA